MAWLRAFCDMKQPISNLLQDLYLVINLRSFLMEQFTVDGG